ncbi:hypothetical protein M434DRAFT_33474 [Hypoxylon sp. CO27-5]|nr:hypothetical protein M434DRAFT_33474 [Hypoxylon sp. CO27-5]
MAVQVTSFPGQRHIRLANGGVEMTKKEGPPCDLGLTMTEFCPIRINMISTFGPLLSILLSAISSAMGAYVLILVLCYFEDWGRKSRRTLFIRGPFTWTFR